MSMYCSKILHIYISAKPPVVRKWALRRRTLCMDLANFLSISRRHINNIEIVFVFDAKLSEKLAFVMVASKICNFLLIWSENRVPETILGKLWTSMRNVRYSCQVREVAIARRPATDQGGERHVLRFLHTLHAMQSMSQRLPRRSLSRDIGYLALS